MKYHQTNKKEAAIYFLIPWERGRELRISAYSRLTFELTPVRLGFIYDWIEYYYGLTLTTLDSGVIGRGPHHVAQLASNWSSSGLSLPSARILGLHHHAQLRNSLMDPVNIFPLSYCERSIRICSRLLCRHEKTGCSCCVPVWCTPHYTGSRETTPRAPGSSHQSLWKFMRPSLSQTLGPVVPLLLWSLKHASLSTPPLFPSSFLVYSSSRPKLKPCSSWENFLGRVKGQSPDSVPFTLYTLAIVLVSVSIISYPTILPPFHMESSLITGSTVSGTYFVPEKYLPS